MKSRFIGTILGIIIFLFLVLGISLVTPPLYRAVNQAMNRVEENYISKISEKTGLGISYDSFSPSVLTGLSINGIKIYDSESKKEVVSLKKIHIGYRIGRVLKGDWQNAFTSLVINGVKVSYDPSSAPAFSEKIKSLGIEKKETVDQENLSSKKENLSSEKDSLKSQGEYFISPETMALINSYVFALPQSVKVKNISLDFSDGSSKIEGFLSAMNFRRGLDSQSVSGEINGRARFSLSFLEGQWLGATFNIKAQLVKESSAASAVITLGDYAKCDWSLGKMEYLVRFQDSSLSLMSTQRLQPYYLTFTMDFESGLASLLFSSRSLNPFSLVRTPVLEGIAGKLNGSTLTSEIKAEADLYKKTFSYDADLGVRLSRKIAPGGEDLKLKVDGDNKNINVREFSAEGQMAQASFSGSCNIPLWQLDGLLTVDHIVMNNGGVLSGDLYFEPQKKGFFAFIPQLFLDEQTLTAISLTVIPEKNALDFSLEMDDYSHSVNEGNEEGKIMIEGSFMGGKKPYIQASLELNSLFLDTPLKALGFFTDREGEDGLKKTAEGFKNYIVSNSIYISSDFSSFSFNSPYTILADTSAERRMAFASFDGNEQNLSVSKFSLVWGDINIDSSLALDYSPEEKQLIASLDSTVNSIPYSLSAMLSDWRWLNISGDYGLEASAEILKGEEKGENPLLSGTARFSSLPLSWKDMMFDICLESQFQADGIDDFLLHVEKLQLTELTSKLPRKPMLNLAFSVNEDGAFIEDAAWKDDIAVLEGKGQIFWNINSGILDSASLELSVSDSLSGEKALLEAKLTNPGLKPLEKIATDFYFDASADISSFRLAHFLEDQNDDDRMSALVNASGTFENPYISLNLKGFSMNMGGLPLNVSGNAAFVDGSLKIPKADAYWNMIKFENISTDINLEKWQGKAYCDIFMDLLGKKTHFPLNFTLASRSEEGEKSSLIPPVWDLAVDAESVKGDLFKDNLAIHALVSREEDSWTLTEENLGIFGFYADSGDVYLNVDESQPFHFSLSGRVIDSVMGDFALQNIYFDTEKLGYLINSEFFTVYSGILRARLDITGKLADPDFNGFLIAENTEFNFPDYIPEHFKNELFSVNIARDNIELPLTSFSTSASSVTARAFVLLDRWSIASLDVELKTSSRKGLPVDVNIPLVRLKGIINADVKLSLEDNTVGVTGDIEIRNSKVTVLNNIFEMAGSSQNDSNSVPWDIETDLNILVGQKVTVDLASFVRGLVSPNTPVRLTMDTSAGLWSINGDVVLRGGEVTYLSRNFYIKEGRILLNESQNSFDPYVTLRAETRETDDNGDSVTITLSAIRQKVSSFNATLYSNPAKSENEIMQLLGQIAAGDSSSISDMVSSTVDTVVQLTLFRKIEEGLRDLLNFDIFSVRTTVVQNAIKLNLNQNSSKAVTIGNYFDNSTVYIGKYFGDTLFADAMLHWKYDESRENDSSPLSGLVFQPEIGFEISAPFANIRWNFAPDLGNVLDTWVSNTSLTLAWRFTF